LKSRDWTEREKDDFSCKFTSSIPGAWYVKDRWEVLAKVLIDEIHLRRSGKPLATVINSVKVSGVLRDRSEQPMASGGKGEACCTSVWEASGDFDNYGYKKVCRLSFTRMNIASSRRRIWRRKEGLRL